jgi:hypothetical protein
MRIGITKEECRWLVGLVEKAKLEAAEAHEQTPHGLLELRRDNMADLERKLNAAIQGQIQKEQRNRGGVR